MNPEIKTRWVSALRSGEYQRGQLFFYKDGRFDILGVLCDLHAKETNTPWKFECITETGERFKDYEELRTLQFFSYLGNCMLDLPEEVQLWAGLDTSSPKAPSGLHFTTLCECGISFKEFADLIEENL